LHDLFDGVPQDDAGTTQFSLAEIVASCFEMVVFDLTILKGELPSCSLARKIVAVGVLTPSSIGAGVWHLVGEVSVVVGHAAPSGSASRTKVVGRFAVSGDMVEPGAVGTMTAFLVLVLCQFVVLCILTVPRNGATGPSPQTESPVFVVWGFLPAMSLVSPCQFPSLAIFVDQLQEAFSGVRSDEALSHRFGASDVRQLIHPELGSPLLRVGLKGLYLLQAEGKFASIRLQVAKAHDVSLNPVISQIFYGSFEGSTNHPFFGQQFEVLVVSVVGRCCPTSRGGF
jgi:hypothetical protein